MYSHDSENNLFVKFVFLYVMFNNRKQPVIVNLVFFCGTFDKDLLMDQGKLFVYLSKPLI